MSQVDYPTSEQAFRRYEADIAAFVNSYPQPIYFTPVSKPVTYVRGFRYAIKACLENQYTPKTFSLSDLRSAWNESVASVETDGRVVVGPRGYKPQPVSTGESADESRLTLTNHKQIEALCILISESILPPQLVYVASHLQQDLHHTTDLLDLGCAEEQDNTFRIV